MKFTKYCMLAFVAALALVGCKEDDFASSVEEGLPARFSLQIEVPGAQTVAMTRGVSEFEYALRDLTLIMFNQSGHREILQIDPEKLSLDQADEQGGAGYIYSDALESVNGGTEILSGNYDVYAIANYNSSICKVDWTSLESKEDVETALAQLDGTPTQVTGAKVLPMTDYAKCEIAPSSTGVTNTIKLTLRRNVTKVEFAFQNGSHQSGAETVAANFTPTHYTVYNLPKSAYLIDRRDDGVTEKSGSGVINDANKLDGVEYFNTERIAITGSAGFTFFMLENNQNAQNTCADYSARDKWNGKDASGNKQFLNAPEKGTYVVVEGNYNDKEYHGTVSYTIHLGDFSDPTSAQKNYNNFKVNRNENHKYTVTVNGATSIWTEAQSTQADGGDNPGIEGSVYKSNNNFVLDSHYENVMLSFDEAAWNTLKARTTHKVRIESPETNFAPTDYTFTKQGGSFKANADGDFGWIQFEKPAKSNEFPVYNNGNKGDGTNKTYAAYRKSHNIEAFFTNPDNFALKVNIGTNGNPKYTYYVAAFVDDYYYGAYDVAANSNRPNRPVLALDKWVNTVNRVFICDFEDAIKSPDGNSGYTGGYFFSFNQRSIKTVYDLNETAADYNPFGIETWDEADQLDFTEPSGLPATDAMDGWLNTANSVYGSGATGTTVNGVLKAAAANTTAGFRPTTSGYLTPVADNLKESHKYKTGNTSNASTTLFGLCLSHNRDKNGNGQIDKNELEWYLPALNQYLITWLGIDELNEDTRLFETADFAKIKVDNTAYLGNTTAGNEIYHMLTSSAGKGRVWWQDQAVSYGSARAGNWEYNQYVIRAARSLKTRNTKCTMPFVYTTKTYGSGTSALTSYIVEMKYVSATRSTDVTGRLDKHYLTAASNLLPKKFELAPAKGLTQNNAQVDALSNDDITPINTKVANYRINTSDTRNWRCANQRELMVATMISAYVSGLTDGNYTCCTLHPSTAYPVPFYFQKSNNSNMTLLNTGQVGGSSSDNRKPRVLPVRDVK